MDHVLIGPAGVFTLNTKNHAGQSVWVAGRTLMVSGKKQRHLYNASHEAARAAKLLTRGVNAPVEVTGVVVVVAPKSMTVRERPSDVVVVSDRQLLGWLSDRPNLLTPRQIAVITAAAYGPERGTGIRLPWWTLRSCSTNSPGCGLSWTARDVAARDGSSPFLSGLRFS